MIVVENKNPVIVGVTRAADSQIAGTEVTVRDVFRRLNRRSHRLSQPGPVLTVRGDDHPLRPQRMPAFFPLHFRRSLPIMRASFRENRRPCRTDSRNSGTSPELN